MEDYKVLRQGDISFHKRLKGGNSNTKNSIRVLFDPETVQTSLKYTSERKERGFGKGKGLGGVVRRVGERMRERGREGQKERERERERERGGGGGERERERRGDLD